MRNPKIEDMPVPAAVYRLQLSADFPFKKAIKILSYLKSLGIEGIYCSPFFKAASDHGYDVTDPRALNPKLGTLKDFKAFCAEIQKLGLLFIADIVPNHMGIKGGENPWWQDVLENGPFSEFATFFDINWSPEKRELQDRVILPILGTPYITALENREIRLNYHEGVFFLRYADYPLPVSPQSYAMVLENESELLKKRLKTPKLWEEFQKLIELFRFFPVAPQERSLKKKEGQRKLAALVRNSPVLRSYIVKQVELFNGQSKKPASFERLDKFLEAQFYRLCYWRVALHEINYRRFFNIHELVSIRIEEEAIFETHDRWLFELIEKGYIQGLRIDHPDGLYDPGNYFARLRKKFVLFTVIEKILGRKEKLCEEWQIEGTVGYEYLNVLNGLFIYQENEKPITDIYEEFIGYRADFESILYDSKKYFTDHLMVSEIETLGLRIDRLSENKREFRDFTRHDLTKALAEVIACFPVYRTYLTPDKSISARDCHSIKIAIEKAKFRSKELDASIFEFLEQILTDKIKTDAEGYKDFALFFQQLSAPITAKGLEDTAFYIYNRLISLNEVGGAPQYFGCSISDFHNHNMEKKEKWPYGFLASSTHDTKRSEDVRMRLNVLSEMPDKWKSEVKKWAHLNSKLKPEIVCANTEYYIYQTLLGAWPATFSKKESKEAFCERIWEVILKSIREAKQETNWVFPDSEYEEAVRTFLFSILSKEKNNAFLNLFLSFHQMLDRYGGWNSLSHAALKIASPGVVDIYQGNEILNYRLVDPDNRKKVDFEMRKKQLASLEGSDVEQLFAAHDLSLAKLFVQAKALHFRLNNKELLLHGSYIPLKIRGDRKKHVVAFMRRWDNQVLIVVAGRFFSMLAAAQWDLPIGRHVWRDTQLLLPAEFKNQHFVDLFTGASLEAKSHGNTAVLSLEKIFRSLSVSYLILSK